MQNVILQVPVSKKVRDLARKAALDHGFSSLQEVIRIFMKRFGDKKIDIDFENIRLSPMAEKRYLRMEEDFRRGRNVKNFTSVDQLIKDLEF